MKDRTINIGFYGILTLIFITLKLCDVIDWPWIYVLMPMLVPIFFVVLIGLVTLIILGASWIHDKLH